MPAKPRIAPTADELAAALGETEAPANVLEKVSVAATIAEDLSQKISSLETDKTKALLEIERQAARISDLEKQVISQQATIESYAARARVGIPGAVEAIEPAPLSYYEIVDTHKPATSLVLQSEGRPVYPVIDEFGFPHYRVSIASANALISSGERWVLVAPKNIDQITISVRRGLYLKIERFSRHVLVRSESNGNKWKPIGKLED